MEQDHVLISVILPTYNEKENIVPLVAAITGELKGRNHEIVIVDDGSYDGTVEALALSENPLVKVYCRDQKRSLAASIRYGLKRASGDIFIIMDSDFNHQPRYLPFMVDALENCDGIFASRFLDGGGTMEGCARFYLSALFNALVRFLLGLKISDALYGFFAIKKKALEACCHNNIFFGHGDYCMRLLYFLQSNNAKISEFPAVNGKRGAGRRKTGFIRMFCGYSKALVSFKIARLKGARDLNFSSLAAPWLG